MRNRDPWRERWASAEGKDRVGDGRPVHREELIKYVNILMEKEASILTVRAGNYKYGRGEN